MSTPLIMGLLGVFWNKTIPPSLPLTLCPFSVNAYTEQVLRDDERPAAVKPKWVEQGVEPQFQLRLRASGIIRIQHRLDGDYEVECGECGRQGQGVKTHSAGILYDKVFSMKVILVEQVHSTIYKTNLPNVSTRRSSSAAFNTTTTE